MSDSNKEPSDRPELVEECEPLKEYEINLDMWKHYDNLRQDKNKTFLAANSILAAAVGLTLRTEQSASGSNPVALLVSTVGFLSCLLWFLLLSRNAFYIKFHRSRVSFIESSMSAKFSTFGKDWEESEKQAPLWARMSSNTTDRLLSIVLAAFWISLVLHFFSSPL